MTTTKYGRIEVYRDRAGKWRWRIRAANGRITATPGESYARKAAAIRVVQRLLAHAQMDLVVLDV